MDLLSYMMGRKSAGSGSGCRINVTTLANADVVAIQGQVSVQGKADENGECIIVAPNDGVWSVTASLAGEDIQTKDIEVVVDYELALDGIDLVPWATGTDEQIVDMITAARNGKIDLQTDGGWKVGDVRTIPISAFVGGGSVECPAQNIDLVITSFADYEGCGAVMQFDFKECLSAPFRMRANASNAGGYDATEMYSTTLPALVEALPSWLAPLLLTFNVKASAGSKSDTIETIPNNKLALRSSIEILNRTGSAKAGEGSWVPYYASTTQRKKAFGISGADTDWWTRSPNGLTNDYWQYINSSGDSAQTGTNKTFGVAPFGCL